MILYFLNPIMVPGGHVLIPPPIHVQSILNIACFLFPVIDTKSVIA